MITENVGKRSFQNKNRNPISKGFCFFFVLTIYIPPCFSRIFNLFPKNIIYTYWIMKLTNYSEFFRQRKGRWSYSLLLPARFVDPCQLSVAGSIPEFWATDWGGQQLPNGSNDGLMANILLLIGLELEQEICRGGCPIYATHLAHCCCFGRNAGAGRILCCWIMALPPLRLGINTYGIDIAFAIGFYLYLEIKCRVSLKVFLTLAVIDDLGAL